MAKKNDKGHSFRPRDLDPAVGNVAATVPAGIIERLPYYLRCLSKYSKMGRTVVSSQEMSQEVGVNAAEIRRDLSYFGNFGRRGVGYNVDLLQNALMKILDAGHEHRIAIIGAGKLGSAIAEFRGLNDHGFHISAIFDVDDEVVGREIGSMTVMHMSDLSSVVHGERIEVGIIAVPNAAAQEAADALVAAGIEVIMNYTPAIIDVPKNVFLHTTDPALELMHTLYYLSRTSVFD